MERVTKIIHRGKEIVYVDYSNVKNEDEMITILQTALEMVVRDNKKYVFCANYTDSFIPSKYMKEATKFLSQTKHLVDKASFLGITGDKNILLSGLTRVFRMNFKTFKDKNAALDYLL